MQASKQFIKHQTAPYSSIEVLGPITIISSIKFYPDLLKIILELLCINFIMIVLFLLLHK